MTVITTTAYVSPHNTQAGVIAPVEGVDVTLINPDYDTAWRILHERQFDQTVEEPYDPNGRRSHPAHTWHPGSPTVEYKFHQVVPSYGTTAPLRMKRTPAQFVLPGTKEVAEYSNDGPPVTRGVRAITRVAKLKPVVQIGGEATERPTSGFIYPRA